MTCEHKYYRTTSIIDRDDWGCGTRGEAICSECGKVVNWEKQADGTIRVELA